MTSIGAFEYITTDVLLDWDVTVSKSGSYQATVHLSNYNGVLDSANYLFKPFEINLQADADYGSDMDGSFFTGSVRWIYGIVSQFTEKEEDIEDSVTLGISSFASRLAKKPVNTVVYDDTTTINTIFNDVSSQMGGLPSPLVSFAATALTTCTALSGDSMLVVFKQLARAAKQDMFVNKNGVLVTENWKDHNSAVDHIIPDQAIMSAEKADSLDTGPSIITLRGCWQSKRLRGRPELQKKGKKDGQEKERGKVIQCLCPTIPKKEIDIALRLLTKYQKGDMIVEVDSPGRYSGDADRVEGGEPSWDTRVTLENTGGEWDGTDQEVTVSVRGYEESEYDEGGLDAEVQSPTPEDENFLSSGASHFLLELMRRMGPAYGGPAATPPKQSMTQTKDTVQESRIYTTIKDDSLIDDFGVLFSEVDNHFVSSPETLFDLGIRQFQEWKMSRNTWKIETHYMPNLNVNDKVTFTTPKFGTVITGLITEMKVNYDPEPNMKMTLQIESMEELGLTTYHSENLFSDHEPGSSESFAWTVSESNGTATLRPGSPVRFRRTGWGGDIYLEQGRVLDIGANYKVKFKVVDHVQGDAVLEVRDSAGVQSTVTASANGNVELDFSPDEVSNTFRFRGGLNINDGASIKNMELIKTVVG
jgi:hypothetical protein